MKKAANKVNKNSSNAENEINSLQEIIKIIKDNDLIPFTFPSIYYRLNKNETIKALRKLLIEHPLSKRKDISFLLPKVISEIKPPPGKLPLDILENKFLQLYLQYSFEKILDELSINYKEMSKLPEKWLPFEPFDDENFNIWNPLEIKEIIKKNGKPLFGIGLWENSQDTLAVWRNALIRDYEAKEEKFIGIWDKSNETFQLCKAKLFIEGEDPRKFAHRFYSCFKRRAYADSIIRYNYYIENMVANDVTELSQEKISQIIVKAQNSKTIKNKTQLDTRTLIKEINEGYIKTMNKIVFDKHIEGKGKELIGDNLILPKKKINISVIYYAQVQIPSYIFSDRFSSFCYNTLKIKDESIKALDDINKYSIEIEEKEIYNVSIGKTLRTDEFRQMQESNIAQTSYFLRETWIAKLKEIIKHRFDKCPKGFFYLHETSFENYKIGKIKKLLTAVRIMMEETLLNLFKKSITSYTSCLLKFIPLKTEVISSSEVKNEYKEKAIETGKPNFPLFYIDLELLPGAELPSYKYDPAIVKKFILQIFDKGINDFQNIPQVEEKIFQHFFKSPNREKLKAPTKPTSEPLTPTSPSELPNENLWIWTQFKTLEEAFTKAIIPVKEYIETYKVFKEEYKLNPEDYLNQVKQNEQLSQPNELKDNADLFIEKEKSILDKIPESIAVSVFSVDCSDVRIKLAEKNKVIAQAQIEMIAQKFRIQVDDLIAKFEDIKTKIKKMPKNIEELSESREYMGTVVIELEKVREEIDSMMDVYETSQHFKYKYTPDEIKKKWTAYGGPKSIMTLIDQQNSILENEEKKFISQMKISQNELTEKVNEIEKQVAKFPLFQSIEDYEEVVKIGTGIMEKLKGFQEEAKLFNVRESLVGKEQTDYSGITQLVADFTPFYNLWYITDLWKKSHQDWLTCKWENLNAAKLEETFEKSSKTMASVLRYFKDKDFPSIYKIAETMKADIDAFKPYVPLAVALRTEGMKDRHWTAISEKIGFSIKPDNEFTLTTVINKNIINFLPSCVDVAETASKEYSIECNLRKMKEDWEKVEFKLFLFKKSGTFFIASFDEASALLDDHIVITQQMLSSFFKKQFEKEIIEWNETLKTASDVIEEWAKCQANWTYLQPIFDSNDIVRQLPNESGCFKSVDQTWRQIMKETKANPKILQSCTRPNLLEKFNKANELLDEVQKGLADYLEEKRSVFARFYFLSDDEMLQILSQTKEVENVRPFLKKVFENISDLDFQQPEKIMTAMFSAEGEKIQFETFVDPRDKGVEFWMSEVEVAMQKSVRKVLLHSINEYVKNPRIQWMLNHPGQCVLNGSQIYWTSEIEQSFSTKEGIKAYYSKLSSQLVDTVNQVRKKMSKMQTITLNALIVIDVHAKDVVDNLVKNNISDKNAFEWISQLRYYWENEECIVKCVQTIFPYGYEYLGNTSRLVITPLTDKCYMTLMGALKLNLGGAPAGPAGTGKTESTKDLAKALAKQCVVFNCSEGMDYKMVAKFFKGLASSGAWCCFDEFNRINIEVLSVIAQQLQQLFNAKADGLVELVFEESNIKLKPTFSVFITMNPGYAGRTELPDNLKALFRPVAMMVPDYAMIAEIRLYSFGFQTARDLARKLVVTFKLSSEQLSYQFHYDYGMRAVTSVINAAGILKQQNFDMNEDQLLLRALRDVNVPKFLKDDLPLFENIILDLFPGTKRPVINYGDLLDSVKKSCDYYNLQQNASFIEKIFQLYDTTQVRHGLMIVGPAGGGKTSNYLVLSKGITAISKKEGFGTVILHIINPKSLTSGQLYGEKDPMTSEWIDGVLALNVIKSTEDKSKNLHWLMFDGPVDTLWIENLNSVLDDSKKLCLNSGQIIKLSDRITMMFEVDDLSQASPATVSRCGMVYMDPNSLGISPLFKSWLNNLTPIMKSKKGFTNKLQMNYDFLVEKSIDFIRRNLIEPVVTVDNNLLNSLLKIIDCFFIDYKDNELKKITVEEIEILEQVLNPIFVFALIWSVGCTSTLEGREKFSLFLRNELQHSKLNVEIPAGGLVYDYQYITSSNTWKPWQETVPPFEVDARVAYLDIVVPTLDSIRMTYILKLLTTNSKHVLTPGPTGTGKSVNINSLLSKGFGESFQSFALSFSAQTSANQTQDALDDKFEKRRKGVYGPPTGKKFLIFVDDLNMPKKEEFGAQPPIELIRQWMDYKGWYNRKIKEKPFMRIEDIIFLAAMGPPGGGRNVISQRLQRHFNIITYTDFQRETIFFIFNMIMKAFMSKFTEPIWKAVENIMNMTINVYHEVIKELLPTPTRSHYTFNLRDISKIIQGIVNVSPKCINDLNDFARLWAHENQRVFGDRLISNEDRKIVLNLLYQQIETILSLKKEDVFNVERIVFGDYMKGIEMEPRLYEQIPSSEKLISKMNEYLDQYNSENKIAMKLVLFLDACDHISRITRVLRQPLGNCLVLGVGGSGRQSLSKLASFISGYKCYQVDVKKGYNMNLWRENIKELIKKCGVENKPTTFLFCDTQIISEQMLEDINNILNTGDVPGLYKKEDMEDIDKVGYSECLKKGLQATKMNKFSQYLHRVKKNIHIVLAMSPMGEVFRNRLRKFPSLVNCCTIDWFTEWSEEALINVAKGSIRDSDLSLGDLEDPCIEMFKIMHQDVEKKSILFIEELRRYNYVTPKSYLELLFLFKKVLTNQREQLNKQIKRLETGLKVLAEANVVVDQLKLTLIKKQPELEQIKQEVQKTKEKLVLDYAEADETRKKVAVEEGEAAEKEEAASKLLNDAEIEVKAAEPELNEALKSVKELKDDKLYEIKAMKTPSKKILLVFECLIILRNVIPQKPKDPAKAKVDPRGIFECVIQTMLNEPKQFKQSLLTFDRDSIPEITIQKLMPILKDESLKEKDVEQASKALLVVFKWVWAMVKYHDVLKKVNPLREKANKMKEIVASERKNLAEKQETLRKLDSRIADLERLNREKTELEQQLAQQIIDCQVKLERAGKIISGLVNEKIRWTETVEKLKIKSDYLIGNSILASGMLTYAGAFTADYRQTMESAWVEHIKNLNLKCSQNLTMRFVLEDPIKTGEWTNIHSLPNDNLSIENSIILHNARRWPLMIDPQNQANNFLKSLGNEIQNRLNVLKANDPAVIKILESSIELGKWVLIENVGEKLDPAWEPLLQQQKIQQGTSYNMKLGDRLLKYEESFRFFMTTRLPNPHYSPETSVMVTLLNFAITPKGLEEQMLNLLILIELPDLQEKKNKIMQENATAEKELRSNEDKILGSLTSYDDTAKILEDVNLIEILETAKKKAAEIKIRVEESKITEKEIDLQREKYRQVAYRASLLYFCINDLAEVDPMYQYSLQWYSNLYKLSVQNSQPHNDPKIRVANIRNYFTQNIFENVCRSLFEKHKLMFSFLLAIKILIGDEKIDMAEWRFFLAGPTGDIPVIKNPFQWLNDNEWNEVYKQLYKMNLTKH